jgi:hypothetical protein
MEDDDGIALSEEWEIGQLPIGLQAIPHPGGSVP